MTTLLDCSVSIPSVIEFSPGSAKLSVVDVEWQKLREHVANVMKAPERKLIAVGHTDKAEGSSARRNRLALRRAEVVRAALVADGVDGARLEARVADEKRPRHPQWPQRVVSFELDPDRPLREDFIGTKKYDYPWCGDP